MNITTLDPEQARNIAIAGLARLAGDDDLLMRFSGLTGILPSDMRAVAGDPGFLVGVLDFYLGHEPDLIEWAKADGFPAETVLAARQALSPDEAGLFE